jgi:hypothetical protein
MRRLLMLSLIVILCNLASAAIADEAPAGFKPLFNGKNLDGWMVFGGSKTAWGADNGILYTTGGGGGWLLTKKIYSNFEIRVEYKLPPDGNSGVGIRCPLKGNVSYTGMEIQILNDPWYKNPEHFKGIRKVQLTGSIYGVVPPSKEVVKPAGKWNAMRVIAKGPHITVILNGTKIVDANLDKFRAEKFHAIAKEHPGLFRKSGHLGLQSHTNRVEFRNIYVKELPD